MDFVLKALRRRSKIAPRWATLRHFILEGFFSKEENALRLRPCLEKIPVVVLFPHFGWGLDYKAQLGCQLARRGEKWAGGERGKEVA